MMRILVVNSGSSSVKFSVFETSSKRPECVLDGEVTGVGGAGARLKIEGSEERGVTAGSAVEALGLAVEAVRGVVDAVGYRVVHPGAKIADHVRVTEEVLGELEGAAAFAPLHDPEAVAVIREGMRRYPGVGHYACFDTVFHRTMPEEAATYPLPEEVRAEGVRRYGFHGLSCESVVAQMEWAGMTVPRRMAIAHLGSGCSVTALVEGRSVDTTMGLTPTGGVVMGTRPGDLDPGVVLYLVREGTDVDGVEGMLNHRAGLVGLTGMANDVKAMRASGTAAAELGLRVFTRSVRKALGGFCWLMGGMDAVVFTGGIGEHDARTRAEVVAGLEGLGVTMNSVQNDAQGTGVRRMSASETRTEVYVVPAQEDLMIAMHVERMAGSDK